MTVDEIFSSESEHLYFRLIAARNALNAASDQDTVQVLNEILDETLNNISRIGTDEEIAAAEEIVVRKSNKTVKDYLTSQKFSLIATLVMIATGVIAALALVMILVSNGESKVKPIITVVLVAAGIIGMAMFVSSYMKKKMVAARNALKGKTVIGCRIDTGSNAGTKAVSSAKQSGKTGRSASQPKVVRNFGGIIKVVLILGVLVTAGFFIYTNKDKIVETMQNIMFNIGLNNPGEEYNPERYESFRKKLVESKQGIYYNEAEKLFANSEYDAAASVYEKCSGYKDANEKRVEAKNWDFYKKAENDISESMSKALVDLKGISGSFKDSEKRIKEYTAHLEFVAAYGSGKNKFNLQDFAKKGSTLYIVEEKLGRVKVSTDVDREEYEYMIVSGNGTVWYIAKDHVLKVVDEEETVLRK